MTKLNNEELVQKAAITAADALATAGKLNPGQSDRFIDYVIDETVLKNNARIVRFRNETLDIDKIGVGARVTVPKAEAADPGVRNGITTSKISLVPKEIMTPFELSDVFKEINIEGDNVEDTIVRLMATQLANDLEELDLNGNKLGPAKLQSEMPGGGSATQYVKDTFLALVDGWAWLAESGNIVDLDGTNVGLTVFSRMLRALPTKFRRNKADLRWYISPDLWQIYQEKLATRATALGDSAANGDANAQGPFGIPAVSVPMFDFQPQQVEHVTLNGTTPVTLKSKFITNVVVTPSTLGNAPTTPYVITTDYTTDLAAGTITRVGGAITDGQVVKVTYQAAPKIILTHKNNFILGIGRDVRIEKDRDIFKGVNQYAITSKVDVQFEELTAIVLGKNIGTGV